MQLQLASFISLNVVVCLAQWCLFLKSKIIRKTNSDYSLLTMTSYCNAKMQIYGRILKFTSLNSKCH